MPPTRIPAQVLAAAADRRSGATPIALAAADGLLAVADRPELLAEAVRVLVAGQPAMAPVWHLARAARAADPRAALEALRAALRADTRAAVMVARAWLEQAGGPAATLSSSSLVDQVLAGRRRAGEGEPAAAGIIGADAIGPRALVNAAGSGALAARLPTLVVAVPAKLVPAGPFEGMLAPGFERVPLERFAAVVVGAELLTPRQAGRRAAALDRPG
ncbi:MAG TPA: hypothetical protein VKG45_11275 [Actinomycetes bacterium]|nr:hypothetical protein [Actinomycetes bacterium]